MPQSREDVLRNKSIFPFLPTKLPPIGVRLLHTSRLWYRTSTQSLDKSRYLNDICQPIRTTFSIRVQWIYNFQFPFQRRPCVVYLYIRIYTHPYDACGTNQIEVHFYLILLSGDCVEVKYHNTLTCGSHGIYNYMFPYPTYATYQIWLKLAQ